MNIILFDRFPEAATIPISDERARHILRILHLGKGDSFLMGVLNGPSGRAVITGIDAGGIHIAWDPQPADSDGDYEAARLYPVTLMVAQVRPICMKRILREAASLGVGRIAVFGTDTGEKSYRSAKLWTEGRYREHLISGAEQAGGTGIPVVEIFDSLDEAIGKLPAGPQRDEDVRISLDIIADTRHLAYIDLPQVAAYTLAIGPERGWSDRERRVLAEGGFAVAGLGSRILRTETACTGALAVLLSRVVSD